MTEHYQHFNSQIEIKLQQEVEIPQGLSYAEKHEFLSSVERKIDVLKDSKLLYSCTVPEHVFNPFGSIVPRRVVELLLDGTMKVKDKAVIDLGCGCGLIGLAALIMGAEKMLFSDINPNVKPLQQHPLLRKQDVVKIQDVLVNEKNASWDTVIACPPSQALNRPTENHTYESGIFLSGDLITRIVKDASRVLKSGGEFFLYVRLPHQNFFDCQAMMMLLHEYFALETMKILDFATGKDFPYGDPDTSALFFSILKK